MFHDFGAQQTAGALLGQYFNGLKKAHDTQGKSLVFCNGEIEDLIQRVSFKKGGIIVTVRNLITVMVLPICVGLLSVNAFGYDRNYRNYETEREEHIEVQRIDSQIVAFRNKKPSDSIDLKSGETVLKKEDEGYMGAVLTNERVLAVSATGTWFAETLKFGEADGATLMVGDEIVLFVSSDRILCANRNQDRFAEMDLPVGDEVLENSVGQTLGVVVLPDRAVGFNGNGNRFQEVQFHIGESYESLEMAATFALVRTDKYIYTYRVSPGKWSEQSIDILE